MTILALEPNPSQAGIIRRIAGDLARANLTLVQSTGELFRALDNGVPDLILLSALISPADEAGLLAYLRNLPDSEHLEVLFTPILGWPRKATKKTERGICGWFARGAAPSQTIACDPRVFAERISWSLQHARDTLERTAETRRQFGAMSETDVRRLNADRRVHQRFSPNDLPGLRLARIKHGPLVRLVDFSAGGALLETEAPLRPEAEATLELVGDSLDSVVPFRVLRCHVSSSQNRTLYLGACAFTHPLDLAELRRASVDTAMATVGRETGFDVAVRSITTRRSAAPFSSIVASLQEACRSRPFDPVARATKDLLALIVVALERGGERAVTEKLIEVQLQAALPALSLSFASTPMMIATPGSEPLYFEVPSGSSARSRVLNVELPQGLALEGWQFRLLRASVYIAGCLRPATELQRGRDEDPAFSVSMTA